jgi:hypothetical protein
MIDYEARMERLRLILNNVYRIYDAVPMIIRQATGIFAKLGINREDAEYLAGQIICDEGITDLAVYEQDIHERIFELCPPDGLENAMQERTQAWFDVLEDHLIEEVSTLDLGGGSGELAEWIQKICRCSVTIADELDWRKCPDIPYVSVTDNHVDAPDGAYEQVVAVTAFHHTDNPPALVAEAFRLARQRVIFIESVTENLMMYAYASSIDHIYNRLLYHNLDITKKINVPCNFLPATGWEQLVWKLTGLKPTVSQNLGIFQDLNPEQHHLLVYNKKL